MIPSDRHIIEAFQRGEARGQHRQKYGREECPYKQDRPYFRDAWLAGYDWGFKCGLAA